MPAVVVRLLIALALALAPAAMANAMQATGSAAMAQAMKGMEDCPSMPASAPDNRCAAYCMAGLPSFASATIEPPDHGPGLTNFSLRPISESVIPRVATPPPR